MPSGRTIEDLAFDQFAGYMSCKEREWLVKIQILQCQGTGNPYEDDYYYTVRFSSSFSSSVDAIAFSTGAISRLPRDGNRPKTAHKTCHRIRQGYAQICFFIGRPLIALPIIQENERRLRRINGSRSYIDSSRESKEMVPLNVKFAGSLGLPSKSSTSNPRHVRNFALFPNSFSPRGVVFS